MRVKTFAPAAVLALSTAISPVLAYGLDLTFLDQAPIRFFNDADLKMMGDTADEVLDQGKDGEGRSWSNDQTGNSGSIKAIRSFTHDGHNCRRIEVVSLARKATRGRAGTLADMCKVDGTWKILRLP